MPTPWNQPALPVTGGLRIPADRAGSGDPNDSGHITPEALLAWLGDEGLGGSGIPPITPEPAEGKIVVTAADGLIAAGEYTILELAAAVAAALSASVESKVPQRRLVGGALSPATVTLTAEDSAKHKPLSVVDLAGMAVAVDGSLFSGGTFECTFEVVAADTLLTFVGTSGLTVRYHGRDPEVSAFAVGDIIHLFVTSAAEAHVITTPRGQITAASLGAASTAAVAAAQSTADAAQTTANGALPKPGGTTAAGGIVTGSGTAGAAVAVSTTTIADLAKVRITTGTAIDASVNTSALAHDTYYDVSSAAGAVAITVSATGRTAGDEVLLRVSNIANPITLAASGVTIKYAAGVNTITTVEDIIVLWWRTTTQVLATIVRAS